jgi:hypothetical protein
MGPGLEADPGKQARKRQGRLVSDLDRAGFPPRNEAAYDFTVTPFWPIHATMRS